MSSKLLAVLLVFIMAVPLGANAQGEGGSCVAGIPLPLPSDIDSANPDFLRGVVFAIAEVNAVLGASGTLICFEIGDMDNERLLGDSGGNAQDLVPDDSDRTILDSLTEGSGELMRFYVTASYELNEGADWPSPWGHYWLYSNRGDRHTTAQPPFGEIAGDYDMPPYITRLAVLREGNSPRVHQVEFAHHDSPADWQKARSKSLFIAGIDSNGEAQLLELTADRITQLDFVTLAWSVPQQHRAKLWEFFAEIVPSDSEEVISIAFVLADAGTVALKDSA
ncbi:MAG: hypothetical protein OXG53_12640 [Chloroflexi bacterium]|nr:hypothetical protein [Chloroflexota bacterium]